MPIGDCEIHHQVACEEGGETDVEGGLPRCLNALQFSGMPDIFEALARALDVGEVTKPADPVRPQRMNANAFCVRNRVFAMRVGDDLVLKLPPKRVAELVASGAARPNVVGGREMREWANLAFSSENRLEDLARESLDYVRDKP